jgi:formate/nitrite transporter
MEQYKYNLDFKTPAARVYNLSKAEYFKNVNSSLGKLFALAVLGGAYISFGSAFAVLISADLAKYLGVGLAKAASGAAFSSGIMLAAIMGAKLFAGQNSMLFGVLDREIKLKKLLVSWVIVFLGNLLGALVFVFIVYYSELWKSNGYLTAIYGLKTANVKVNLSFLSAFMRGVGGGWLVCLAVWMALSTKEILGKVTAVFFPATILFAMGFEYVTANMYLVPMGLLLEGTRAAGFSGLDLSGLTLGGFIFSNLIPVTLGNLIGSGFFVTFSYWYLFLRKIKGKRY